MTSAASAFSAAKRTFSRASASCSFAVHAGDLVPHEHVHPLAAQRPRQIQGHRHVLPEQMLPLGVAHQPPVPGRHVSGVEVEERHVEAGVSDGALYRPRAPPRDRATRTRPPRSLLRRPPEPFQERDLLEQDGNVRAEPHADPPSATSITQPGAELPDGYNAPVREDLKEIFAAGLAAADPQRAVRRELELEDGAILAGEKRFEPQRVFVLAAGKAAGDDGEGR